MAAAVRETGLDWSYAKGTAVHLDLVACATFPVWGKLNSGAHQDLVNKCFPKFKDSLAQIPSEAWLLLDGQMAFDTVKIGCRAKVPIDEVVGGDSPLHVWGGQLPSAFGDRKFLGWSKPVNWQKNPQPLVEWVSRQVR
jgi:hypothetical protein